MESNDKEFGTVKLPSKGECYRGKTDKLSVAYLTASDEDIIVSEGLRNDGKMCDVLLRKKILNADSNVEDLCIADRQAVLLWLRRTGYGDAYTYVDEQGETREIDLSTITFKEFSLKGDEQGHFEHVLTNGDTIKFRLLTHKDEIEISDFTERLNKEILLGNDVSEVEYYEKVARHLLGYQIISINGDENVEDWLNALKFKELRPIVEYLQGVEPESESTYGLDLDEYLFNGVL